MYCMLPCSRLLSAKHQAGEPFVDLLIRDRLICLLEALKQFLTTQTPATYKASVLWTVDALYTLVNTFVFRASGFVIDFL